MKIIHVVSGINDEACGPSYSIPRLCQSLSARGNNVVISCAGARGKIGGIEMVDFPRWPILTKFAISPGHIGFIASQTKIADIIHNHSLWTLINVASGIVIPGRKAKLVTSPRGTLSQWALSNGSRLKTVLWPIQKRALSMADLLHATSEAEYIEIRNQGFSAPVAIIPNGIDLAEFWCKNESCDRRNLLFLSRLHPTKCLDILLNSWLKLQNQHPIWNLVIAGQGEAGYVQEMRELADSLKLKRVHFVGPLYGTDKSRAYYDADLFVLPTHSENFGMVVAEALAHGCPAIVSKGAPWSGLIEQECGWWIENNIDSLVSTLHEAMSMPTIELRQMGLRGRAWMERNYGWDTFAYQMEKAYEWVINGGRRPDWVREA